MYLIKQRIRAYLFVNFVLYKYLLIRSLLRHCHLHQGSDEPTAKDSEGVFNCLSGTGTRCHVQVDNFVCCGDSFSGSIARLKLFLNLIRFASGIWHIICYLLAPLFLCNGTFSYAWQCNTRGDFGNINKPTQFC